MSESVDHSAASGAAARQLLRLGLVVATVTCLFDQATKLWLIFIYDLAGRGMVGFAPFVDLVMTWNTGISYGLFQQESALGRWLLLGFTLGALAFLAHWLTRAGSRLAAVSLGLIIGGAVGNAIDRAAYGAVADFVYIHFPLGGGREFGWYIFNIADAAIVAGVVGLLYETVFPSRAAKAP